MQCLNMKHFITQGLNELERRSQHSFAKFFFAFFIFERTAERVTGKEERERRAVCWNGGRVAAVRTRGQYMGS